MCNLSPPLRTASTNAARKEQLESTFVAAEDHPTCQRIHSNYLQRCRQHVVHGHQQFSSWRSPGIALPGEFKALNHAPASVPMITASLTPFSLESLAAVWRLAPPHALLSVPLLYRLGHVA